MIFDLKFPYTRKHTWHLELLCTVNSTQCNLHFARCTLHFTLYTPHVTLTPHIILYTLHTPHSALHTPYTTNCRTTLYTLYTAHYMTTFHTSYIVQLHSTCHTAHSKLHTLYNAWLHSACHTIARYTPHFTLSSFDTSYVALCTFYTPYTIHITRCIATLLTLSYTTHWKLHGHTIHSTYTLHSTLHTFHSTWLYSALACSLTLHMP